MAAKVSKAKGAKSIKPSPQASGAGHSNATLCAVLSYFLVGIIWYFADDSMKKESFARFHAKQGLVLFVAWIIVWAISSVVFFIPVLGRFFWFIAYICFLVLWIMGIVYAATGKEKPLPVIGGFAEKLSF